jgi:hypothetical protein
MPKEERMSRLNSTHTKGEKDEHAAKMIEWLAAVGTYAIAAARGLDVHSHR